MEGKRVQESSVTLSHVMMPQDANPAGNIHGGVIMKHIDEAAGVVEGLGASGSGQANKLIFIVKMYKYGLILSQ